MCRCLIAVCAIFLAVLARAQEVRLSVDASNSERAAAPVLLPQNVSALWVLPGGPCIPTDVFRREMTYEGTFTSGDTSLMGNDCTYLLGDYPDVAVIDSGTILVTAADHSGTDEIQAQLFDTSWSPLGPVFVVTRPGARREHPDAPVHHW